MNEVGECFHHRRRVLALEASHDHRCASSPRSLVHTPTTTQAASGTRQEPSFIRAEAPCEAQLHLPAQHELSPTPQRLGLQLNSPSLPLASFYHRPAP